MAGLGGGFGGGYFFLVSILNLMVDGLWDDRLTRKKDFKTSL